MTKQVLRNRIAALILFGCAACMSWAQTSAQLKPNATMVAYVDNDNALSFLIGAGSKPYMTISINMKGDIMASWGDESKRTMYTCTSMTELKKAILDRYNVGDKPKAGEMYHIEFDVATPKTSLASLKNMLLSIGVKQCELTGIRDMANHRTPPSPPKAVTQNDVLRIQEETPSAAPAARTTSAASSNNTGEIYQVVEVQPEFPGGMQALMKFLRDNIQYPRISRENNSQGKAYVNFVVNTDGSIQDVEIMKSSSDVYLDREAVRVVKSMPKWNPGKQAGKAVRVRFTLPVTFRLQ